MTQQIIVEKIVVEKIVVLGTGGTIAGTAASATDNTGYVAAQIGVGTLFNNLPGLQAALQGCELLSEQVAQLDSKDMDFDTMLRIARLCVQHLSNPQTRGIVITHGTDTLEETAYFLHRVIPLELQTKPVVLTCAMRPATSSQADGPRNLRDAVSVATDLQARGVLAVCAGDVHHALAVQKIHSYALNAFSSGDVALGELGCVAQIKEGRVLWNPAALGLFKEKKHFANAEYALSDPDLVAMDALTSVQWPRVEIVLNHTQASGDCVAALIAASTPANPLRGIVVAATGNGTVSESMQAAIHQARIKNVAIVFASRCAWGGVRSTSASSSVSSLSAVKARIELVLSLLKLGA